MKFFSGLKSIEAEVNEAAPYDTSNQTIKESFLKFSSETNEAVLNNQIYFDALLNPTKSKARLEKYQ